MTAFVRVARQRSREPARPAAPAAAWCDRGATGVGDVDPTGCGLVGEGDAGGACSARGSNRGRPRRRLNGGCSADAGAGGFDGARRRITSDRPTNPTATAATPNRSSVLSGGSAARGWTRIAQRGEHRVGVRRSGGRLVVVLVAIRGLAAERIQNQAHGSVPDRRTSTSGSRDTAAIMPVAKPALTRWTSLDGAAALSRSMSRRAVGISVRPGEHALPAPAQPEVDLGVVHAEARCFQPLGQRLDVAGGGRLGDGIRTHQNRERGVGRQPPGNRQLDVGLKASRDILRAVLRNLPPAIPRDVAGRLACGKRETFRRARSLRPRANR